MAIPVQYLNFKAAGIYRVVYDKSTVVGVDSEILRLVIGYSEKGPFNSPTYIKSQTDFKALFGGISKKLEKRGIYFHRMALQCLEEGPIIALNLKKFSGETVDALNIDLKAEKAAPKIYKVFVEDIYDTSRFWTLDAHRLNEVRRALLDENGDPQINSTGEYNKGAKLNGYIKISATSTKECSRSIFVRPASGNVVSQYNMTVADWYKAVGEDIPEYFEGLEQTILADYFAQIYVFGGKFEPTQVLASDVLSKYFDGYTDENGDIQIKLKSTIVDSFGDNIDPLEALYTEDIANPVGRYTGALIPYFKDSQDRYAALDVLFNNEQEIHNLMMTFDEDVLDEPGSASLINLSGNAKLKGLTVSDIFNGKVTSSSMGNDDATVNFGIINVAVKHYVEDLAGNKVENGFYINGVPFSKYEVKEDGIYNTQTNELITETITDDKGNKIQVDGVLTEDFKIKEDKTSTITEGNDMDADITFGKDSLVLCQILDEMDVTLLVDKAKLSEFLQEKIDAGQIELAEDETLATIVDSIYDVLPEEIKNVDPAKVLVVSNDSLPKLFNVGDNVLDVEGEVAIVQAVGTFDVAGALKSFVVSTAKVTSDEGYIVRIDQTLNSEIGNLVPYYLEGYTFKNDKPAGTSDYYKQKWQEDILSTLTDYKGLRTGLLSKSDCDYRYIVDTFQSFISADGCKHVLSFLAKEKQSAFAILNFPAVQTFVKSEQPSFTNVNGVFNVQYVVDGYNKKKASSFKFTLPSDSQGASFCAFYTPLKYSDGYVSTIVPSAGVVSNLFIEKYKSRQPYYIIAGPNYGAISAPGMTGPDYNYTQAELQILEPFGVNALVYRPGFGTFINANQTAKQTPKSALSSVNVRELVIYLQDEIEKVLQTYQWEFNNPTTRQAIKDRADQICERVKANGGIQAYLNIIDESNNTADIIDNEMCVLSTHIEAGRGAGKMIQELTLYRTGQLSSMIFE